MNLTDKKYNQFGLVRDMMQTPGILAKFNVDQAKSTAARIAQVGKLFLTGEGSSRIFPAKHMMLQAMRRGLQAPALFTDAGRQSQEYQLSDWAVFALSNSGRTSEVIKLFTELKNRGHKNLYSLTAAAGSKLESLATQGYVLSCGPEGAVAATKSVQEQALFYHALLDHLSGQATLAGQLPGLGGLVEQALTTPIPADLVRKIAAAGTIYFAGRNDGVAEELTLKTNEITRRKSDFLEGTYAVHGIEEVMNPDDVVIWLDPYADSESKFTDVLVKGVGLTVIAVADHDTAFPTIRVPSAGDLSGYVMMAAGWNLLVEVGVHLSINLDKPTRARKVGNEFMG